MLTHHAQFSCINTYQKIKWTLLWMLKWTKPMRLHIRPHTFSRLGVGPGVWALRERLVCNQVIQTSCCLSCYADNLALVQWGLADRHVDCWWQMVRMMCSTWWEHQSFFCICHGFNPMPCRHASSESTSESICASGRDSGRDQGWEGSARHCQMRAWHMLLAHRLSCCKKASWNAWSVTWLAKGIGR